MNKETRVIKERSQSTMKLSDIDLMVNSKRNNSFKELQKLPLYNHKDYCRLLQEIEREVNLSYNVVDYFNVLGNEEEGYEVNGLSRTEIFIDIYDNMDDLDILVALAEKEYLKPEVVRKGNFTLNYYDDMIEIETVAGYPVCRLELAG